MNRTQGRYILKKTDNDKTVITDMSRGTNQKFKKRRTTIPEGAPNNTIRNEINSLKRLLHKIKTSRLVSNHDTSKQALEHVESLLNKIKIDTDFKKIIKNNLILYNKVNSDILSELLSDPLLEYQILLCNSSIMSKHFHIDTIVDISYDKSLRSYQIIIKDAIYDNSFTESDDIDTHNIELQTIQPTNWADM